MSIAPINLSVDEVVEASGLGRTTVFARIRSGELESIKDGRRRLIPVSALHDYMQRRRLDEQSRRAA